MNHTEQAVMAEETPGVYTHVLETPFVFEGKTYEKLEFHFDTLTGRDMLKVESEMLALGEMLISPELSAGFTYRMAARAAGVSAEVVERLPFADFNRIRRETKNFMNGR